MRVIVTGCEYTGTSTLARGFVDRLYDEYGGRGELPPRFSIHDHFEVPDLVHEPLTDQERDSFLGLAPRLKEVFQRYNILHHTPQPQATRQTPSVMVLVGFHIAEAVYAPMYFGYGLEGEPLDRGKFARRIDGEIMEFGPDTVMALLTASPEDIARRMAASRHRYGTVQEKDIETVLARFDEEYAASTIGRKLRIDTGGKTPEETLEEFVLKFQLCLSDEERAALSQRAGGQA